MYINGKPARDSPRESEREMQKYFLLPWTRALLTDNIFSDMRPRSVHDLKREFSAMNEQAKFSRREREIMDIIYARGQASATELAEAIADHPSRDSLRTLLRILEERGHVKHFKKGREFVYQPSRPVHKIAQSSLQRLLGTFFSGSIQQAVAAHLADPASNVTEDELKRLAQLIRQARGKGRS
jgi:predicted transcriptional regulator